MGGNVFENSESIKNEYIGPTVSKFMAEMKSLFPNIVFPNNINYSDDFCYLGSTNKKPISGDIDIGVNEDFILNNTKLFGFTEEDINTQFNIFKKRARTATDFELKKRAVLFLIAKYINNNSVAIDTNIKKVSSAGLFFSFPQYTEDYLLNGKTVQIDWMVGNIDWLKFSYYSEIEEDTTIKGLHRTQLLVALFDAKGYSFKHNNGVFRKEDKKLVAHAPKEVLVLLNKLYPKLNLDENNLSTFSSIYKAIDNLPFVEYYQVIKTYFRILDRTRCDIPSVLQDEWLTLKESLGLTGKFLPKDSLIKDINV